MTGLLIVNTAAEAQHVVNCLRNFFPEIPFEAFDFIAGNGYTVRFNKDLSTSGFLINLVSVESLNAFCVGATVSYGLLKGE